MIKRQCGCELGPLPTLNAIEPPQSAQRTSKLSTARRGFTLVAILTLCLLALPTAALPITMDQARTDKQILCQLDTASESPGNGLDVGR